MSQLEKQSVADKLKWYLAIVVVIAGVVASLYFVDDFPTVVRVLMVIGGLLLGALIGYNTTRGKEFTRFVKDANIERQKIVWPTRNETFQTTLVVIGLVIIFGIFLFLADTVFSNLIKYFFGES